MAKWKVTINQRGRGRIEVDGHAVADVFGLSVMATAGKPPMLALTVRPTELEVEGDGEVVREPQATGSPVRPLYQCAGCGQVKP